MRTADDLDVSAAQVMEAGERELLDIVQEGMSAEVKARKSTLSSSALEGLSVGDIFFSQVLYSVFCGRGYMKPVKPAKSNVLLLIANPLASWIAPHSAGSAGKICRW